MKKVFVSVLLLSLVVCLVGCSNRNFREYKELPKDKVLVLANGDRMANNTTTVISQSYLTKAVSRNYTLLRSSFKTGAVGEVQYQNYWYRINVTQVTDQELLGKQTVTVNTSYAYLIYTEDESLSVKTTIVTSTSFDYKGGWVEREYEKIVNLNDYFATETELYSAIPEFRSQIDSDNIEKYYLDITVPTTTETNYQQINTFYYFD